MEIETSFVVLRRFISFPFNIALIKYGFIDLLAHSVSQIPSNI